jgi:hypothetical protein
MIFTTALVCVALFAAAQGAAVGQIEDIAFEFEGEQFHLTPLEKRQATSTSKTVPPKQLDEVSAKNSNNNNNNNNNNDNSPQVRIRLFGNRIFFLNLRMKFLVPDDQPAGVASAEGVRLQQPRLPKLQLQQ